MRVELVGVVWLVALAPAAAQAQDIDGPPVEWLTQNSPYGMDVTMDGKVWVNTNPVGQRDDFAILGNDLYRARQVGGLRQRLWVRGYHRRNPDVNYRESKLLVNIDCAAHRLWIEMEVHYDAEGRTVATSGPSATNPIVPGSHGEAWERAACPR